MITQAKETQIRNASAKFLDKLHEWLDMAQEKQAGGLENLLEQVIESVQELSEYTKEQD